MIRRKVKQQQPEPTDADRATRKATRKLLASLFGFDDSGNVDRRPLAEVCCSDCGEEMTVFPEVWEFSQCIARIWQLQGFGILKSSERFRCDACTRKFQANRLIEVNREYFHAKELFERLREGTLTEEGRDWLCRRGWAQVVANIDRERAAATRKRTITV